MITSVRFDCPSVSLSLKGLLKRTRRALWIGGVLAFSVHLMFTQLGGFGEEQKAAKPLTTQFIKRQPRLTKPLEMKKRPQPKRRRMQRKMVSIKAKINRAETTTPFQSVSLSRCLAKAKVVVDRQDAFSTSEMEPRELAEKIAGKKESRSKMDMTLEMLDVEALDTGRYGAMAIQDPNDKRNIRGYFHMMVVYPSDISDRSMGYINKYAVPGLNRVVQAMNEYTGIRADMSDRVCFGDVDIFRTPWIYFRYGWPLQDAELANLGKYVLQGGILFFDSHFKMEFNRWSETHNFIQMGEGAMSSQGFEKGRHYQWETLPSTHALYHCYFDFDSTPPGRDYYAGTLEQTERYKRCSDIDAIVYQGRVLLTMGYRWYGYAWSLWPGENRNVTRQLQFAVNMIVFALTQEGSMTQQAIDSVNY